MGAWLSITVKRVYGWSIESVNAFATVLVHRDVQPTLDAHLQSFVGMVLLLDRIRRWETIAYACFNDGTLSGLAWGDVVAEGTLACHDAFIPHHDVAPMLRECLARAHADFGVRRCLGQIPVTHRAARIVALKAGFRKVGPSEDGVLFYDQAWHPVRCDDFVLELE